MVKGDYAATRYKDFSVSMFTKKESMLSPNSDVTVDGALYATYTALPKYTIDTVSYSQTNLMKISPELGINFKVKDYGLVGSLVTNMYVITNGSTPSYSFASTADVYKYDLNKSGFMSKLSLDKTLTKSATVSLSGLSLIPI